MVRDDSKREQASSHGSALVSPRLCILAYSSLLSAILAAGFLLRKRSACVGYGEFVPAGKQQVSLVAVTC